ncbi:hypothetical protein HY469_01765 [Candidatus Roizmanbacteria bacterium]|nr:hypothetical protein [Candidatus Roizmanbacteria bacterium]
MTESRTETPPQLSPETQALQTELRNLQASIDACRATIVRAENQAAEIGQKVSLLSTIDSTYQGDERTKQSNRLLNVLNSGRTTVKSFFESLGGKVTSEVIEQKISEVESQSQTPEARAFREGKSVQEVQEQRSLGTQRTYGDTAKPVITDEEHVKPEGYATKYQKERDQYQQGQELARQREQMVRESDPTHQKKQETLTEQLRGALNYQEQQTFDALLASRSATVANFTDAKGKLLSPDQIKQKLRTYEEKHVSDIRDQSPTISNVPSYGTTPVPAWRDKTDESNIPERFRLIPNDKGVLEKPPLPENEELAYWEAKKRSDAIKTGQETQTTEQRTKILDRVKSDLTGTSSVEIDKAVQEMERVLGGGLISMQELFDNNGNVIPYSSIKRLIEERAKSRTDERTKSAKEGLSQSLTPKPVELTAEDKATIEPMPQPKGVDGDGYTPLKWDYKQGEKVSAPLSLTEQILNPQLRSDIEQLLKENTIAENELGSDGKLRSADEIQALVDEKKSKKNKAELEEAQTEKLTEDLKREAPDFYSQILDQNLRDKLQEHITAGRIKMEDAVANLINGTDTDGNKVENQMPDHPAPKSPAELQALIQHADTEKARSESKSPAYYELILDTSTRDAARKLIENGTLNQLEVFDAYGKPLSGEQIKQKLLPHYLESFPETHREKIRQTIEQYGANFADFMVNGIPVTDEAMLNDLVKKKEEEYQKRNQTQGKWGDLTATPAPETTPPPARSGGLFGNLRRKIGVRFGTSS